MTITLRNGAEILEPLPRLLQFCREEYIYYDGLPHEDPNQITPLDVLATVSVNSFVNNAAAVRSAHKGISQACNPILPNIPIDADLLSADPPLKVLEAMLTAAIQVPGVLIPVATKVLHRKRPGLIPMLDNVVIGHYLDNDRYRQFSPKTQDKRHAGEVAMIVLQEFRDDLLKAENEVVSLQKSLASAEFPLTAVRIYELLLWTEKEGRGYYRAAQ